MAEPKDYLDIEAIVKQIATDRAKLPVIRRLTPEDAVRCICGHYKRYHDIPCDLEGNMKCKYTNRHCKCKRFRPKYAK